MRTILNRIRKLEHGHLSSAETEAGRRVRESNAWLNRRMAAAAARLKALGYEMPEMSEAEREELSGLSLGQAIRRRFERHVAKRKETKGLLGPCILAGITPEERSALERLKVLCDQAGT